MDMQSKTKLKLRKEICSFLENYDISSNEEKENLIQSCIDEFQFNIKNGASEQVALKMMFQNLNNILKSNYKEIRKSKFKYSFICSIVFLAIMLLIQILGSTVQNVLEIYKTIYPLLLITALGLFVYTFLTYKKRTKIDFIISSILLISILVINIQGFIFFYKIRTGDFFYSLYNTFPGLLEFNKHVLVSLSPVKYEISKTIILFDPTFSVSMTCSTITLIFLIIEKKKRL